MAKIFTYTVIFAGVMALLSLMGIETGSGIILKTFLFRDLSLWGTSGWLSSFSAVLAIAATVGIIASFFVRTQTESILSISLVIILISFVTDMASIIIYSQEVFSGIEWLGNIVLLVLFPLFVGYGISLVQWWRGNDI